MELISNILHRARSVALIRSTVVRIDTRPPEGARPQKNLLASHLAAVIRAQAQEETGRPNWR
ncbi:MAG TPA: hypothetical protein VH249_10730, partial [Xanthobacteraceae bacterium]|nr:hypothetical protein [Xanthobacteraceae bacterium]